MFFGAEITGIGILCLLHNSKLLKQAIPFVAYIINY